jgi:hypothetical protein
MRPGLPLGRPGLSLLGALLALAGCGPAPVPPAALSYAGLPVSGSLADARHAGFARCQSDNVAMRCRRSGVMLAGQGPYEAAVDLRRSDGSGGFHQLTMWHDGDQAAVQAVGPVLLAQGWTLCRTGQADRGDQMIYRKAGEPVRVSVDASYWGKRRLRVLPEQGQPTGKCW